MRMAIFCLGLLFALLAKTASYLQHKCTGSSGDPQLNAQYRSVDKGRSIFVSQDTMGSESEHQHPTAKDVFTYLTSTSDFLSHYHFFPPKYAKTFALSIRKLGEVAIFFKWQLKEFGTTLKSQPSACCFERQPLVL